MDYFFTGSKGQELLDKATITTSKTTLLPGQTAEFTVEFHGVKTASTLIPQAFAQEIDISANLMDSEGDKVDTTINIVPSENDTYKISVEPPKSFTPGGYTLKATLEDSGAQKELSQDFTWGVLALNTNKSVFQPGENAQVSMAVLDDKGFMVCDADVTLLVTAPDNTTRSFKTSDNTIKVTDQCHTFKMSLEPDYFTQIALTQTGLYTLQLTATTKTGSHTITDSVLVGEDAYKIERISATRLYPFNQYPMTLKVTAPHDMKGYIEEIVPSEIAIVSTHQDTHDTDYAAVVINEGDHKIIRWKIDWKKGTSHSLSYIYDAPNISPQFYVLGKLSYKTSDQTRILDQRYWQLANDGVGTVRPDGDVAVTENFTTCTTNGNGNCRFGVVDESVEITGDYVSTGTANDDGTGGDEEEFTMESAAGTLGTVTNVDVKFQALTVGACNGSGGTPCDDITTRITIDGSYQTGQVQAMTTTDTLYTKSFAGTWTGDDDLQIEFVRTINGGGSAATRDDDVRIYQAWAEVTFTSIDVTGNVYNAGTSNALTECDANAGTYELRLRTSGSTYSASCSSADGSFTFTNVVAPSTGAGMVMWIDDAEAPETDGALVVRYDGSGNSTSNIFYDDTVTITSDDTNGVTNANMDTYDNADDADIPYTVTTNNLTVNSAYELLVKIKSGVAAGSTVYAPGGTVTTNATGGDLHLDDDSDATLDTATSAIGRDIVIDTGATLTVNASTTVGGGDITATGTLDTTAGTPTITIRGTGSISGAGTKTVYNLTVGDGTTATTTLSGALTANNDVAVGTGSTFNVNATLNISGGDFTTTTTGIVNTTAGTPTVTITGSGNVGPGAGGSFTVYDLTIDGTQTLSGTVTANNDVAVNTGDSLALASQNVTISGGDLATVGTGTVTCSACSGGTVDISGTGNIGGGGTVTVYNLTINGTQTLASATTTGGDVTVAAGDTLALGSQNLNVNGGDLTTTTTGTVTCSACSAGTVTLTATGNLGAGAGGTITVYNLATSGTGTTTLTSTITANNDISIGAGTTLALSDQSVTVSGGDFATVGTGTVTCSGCSSGTVAISGTGNIGGGGTVTVYNLTINGTQTLASGTTASNDVSVAAGATLNLGSQNLAVNGGDFTTTTTGIIACSGCSGGTVTMSGTGNLGGGNGAITFYNLATSGTGTTTFSGGGTNTVSNNVTVGAGTTLNINSSTTVTGNLTNTTTGIIGTSAGTPTLTIQGTSLGGGSGAITFHNLTKSGAGTTTFSGAGTNTINSNLSVNAGTFTQSNALSVTGDVSVATGATFNTNATLNILGGDLATTGTGVVNTTAGTATTTISGTGNIGGGGTVTVYNLTINGIQTLQSALVTSNDLAINASDNLAINNQNITVGGGDFTTASGASVSCGCTSGTVTVNGSAATGIGGNSVTMNFYNLTIGGTVPVVSTVTVANDLTSNGTLSGSQNVTVNGHIQGTGTITMSGGTVEQRVALSKNFGTTSGTNVWTFATLIFSNSSGASRTITTQTGGSGGITVSTLLQVGQGSDTQPTVLDAGNRTWTLSGTSGTPFDIIGSSSLTGSTSTFSYTGNNGGGNTTIQTANYTNLTCDNGSETFVPEGATLTINGDLTVTSGILSLGSSNMSVGSSGVANSGNISVAGTLSQSSGTVTILSSSGGAASIGGSGSITFSNLSIAPAVASGPTITLGTAASQTITVSGTLTVGNNTNGVTVTAAANDPVIDVNGSVLVNSSAVLVAPPSSAFTVAADFTNNGTFTANNGTVTMDTTGTSILNGSGNPAITFYGFRVVTPGKTVQFTAGKTFRFNGLLTVTGAAGNMVHFHSTSDGNQYFINHQGTESISYLHIHDAGTDGTSTEIGLNPTNTNAGNNGAAFTFEIGKRVVGTSRIRGNTRIE